MGVNRHGVTGRDVNIKHTDAVVFQQQSMMVRRRHERIQGIRPRPFCLLNAHAVVFGKPGQNPGFAKLFWKYVSQAPNLCAHATQLLFNILVPAIDVVHTVDDRLSVGYQRRQHE